MEFGESLLFQKVKQYVSGKILAYFTNPNNPDERPSFNLEALQLRVNFKTVLELDTTEEEKAISAINNAERSKLKIYRPTEEE